MVTQQHFVSAHAPVNRAHLGHALLTRERRAVPTVPPAPSGGSTGKRLRRKHVTELQRFLWAEGEQESNNNYDAVNPGSGALGRWQVMPSNLPNWLPESGCPQETPAEFLQDHNCQNKVALTILGGYFHQYGPAGAAAMWYSGQPDPTKTYGTPPVYQYVNDVLALMHDPNVGTITSTGVTIQLPWEAPPPDRKDSWSSQVTTSAKEFHSIAVDTASYARIITASYRR